MNQKHLDNKSSRNIIGHGWIDLKPSQIKMSRNNSESVYLQY